MTSLEKLKNSLSAIDENIKAYPDFHRGHGENYITYEIIQERDTHFADDEPNAQIDTVRVHYFTKSNPTPIKKAIRRMLRSDGFSISYTEQLRESNDTGYYHVIIQATALGETDYDDTESEDF